MKRDTRKTTAEETVAIIESGQYTAPSGQRIDLRESIEQCKANTVCHGPGTFTDLLDALAARASSSANITVRNETTLAGAQALLASGHDRVACLNFASAKNPGGGFLGGAEAQEEAICRPSALYASLLTARESYYETNRHCTNALYTDYAIYSPDVPVFRSEDGELLEEPYLLSFVTAPAPNRGALEQNSPHLVEEVESVFRRRIENVLTIMANHRHENVVLGAWGCGVFRNSPNEVAAWFRDALHSEKWRGRFAQVRFSILDRSANLATHHAFLENFAPARETRE